MNAPTRNGRPEAGSIIHVPAYGRCLVLPHTDPAVVILHVEATGSTVRVGEKVLPMMLLAADDTEASR
jgi:hypothetical protein